jgi:hypothetical protein
MFAKLPLVMRETTGEEDAAEFIGDELIRSDPDLV